MSDRVEDIKAVIRATDGILGGLVIQGDAIKAWTIEQAKVNEAAFLHAENARLREALAEAEERTRTATLEAVQEGIDRIYRSDHARDWGESAASIFLMVEGMLNPAAEDQACAALAPREPEEK